MFGRIKCHSAHCQFSETKSGIENEKKKGFQLYCVGVWKSTDTTHTHVKISNTAVIHAEFSEFASCNIHF